MMKNAFVWRALCSIILSLACGVGVVHAQGKVDTEKYITLTVAKGAKIKLAFSTVSGNDLVKVTGVVGEQEEKGHLAKEYETTGTEIKVYGAVSTFECQNNKQNITALDASKNPALKRLYCSNNQLSTLNLSTNPELFELSCYLNQLTTLDMSSCTKLVELVCNNNKLQTLDVSKNLQLKNLSCHNNQLRLLDVKQNEVLERLMCDINALNTLDVSKNLKLEELRCMGNRFTTLDIQANSALKILDCDDNQLTTLDLSKNIALSELSCRNNWLVALDLKNNANLTKLKCFRNQLTSLDVSKNTKLAVLECDNNQIRSLQLGTNLELTELICDNNQLTNLDVSANKKLKKLQVERNLFSTSSLNALYCSLPDRSTETKKGIICPVATKDGGDDAADRLLVRSTSGKIATDKNWAIQYSHSFMDIEGITGNEICGGVDKLKISSEPLQWFSYKGGEWEFSITSTDDWKIDETTPLPTWLKVEPKQGKTGADVKVTVDPANSGYVRRYALTFVLANDATTKRMVMIHRQRKPPLSVTYDKGYKFAAAGEEKEDLVTVECTDKWVATGYDMNWCVVIPGYGDAGTTQVKIKVFKNKGAERNTKITFALQDESLIYALKDHTRVKQEVEITQLVNPELKVNPESVASFTPAESTKTFTVESNYDWTVTGNDETWCTVEPKAGIAGTHTVTMTVKANTGSERSTKLTFALKDHPTVKKEVEITQAANPELKVNPESVAAFTPTESTKTFTVESNYDWTVTGNDETWCTVEPKAGIAGTHTVTMTVKANTGSERSTKLTFALKDHPTVKKEVEIKQEAKPNDVEDVLLAEIVVTPNPFEDVLYLRGAMDCTATIQYRLLNTVGVAVRSGKIEASETMIDTRDLRAGNYLLWLFTSNSSKIVRIVKE